VLIGLKQLEKCLKQSRQATLTLIAGPIPPSETELTNTIIAAGYKIASSSVIIGENAALKQMSCEVSWHARHNDFTQPIAFLKELGARFGLAKIDWCAGDKTAVP
jgi:hypothetical protein